MSRARTVNGVRVIGDAYVELDQARNRLFEVISAASDRSSRSDELAAHITDWPSRYTLSRLRGNVALPLRLEQGSRVLDVGCGTGPVTRAVAERGAVVTGLESSLARARVAAARSAGLGNCDIVCGSLAEYRAEGHAGEFDVVLLCGVLGNASYDERVFADPAATLALVAELLAEGGVVVVSLENQIGLKYLLGYAEDRRGIPWVGIDGYRSGRNPARTWTRPELASILSTSGFTEQQWLYPYPDHTFPTVLARDGLFESEEGRNLLQLLVRKPVQDYRSASMLTADPVSALRTMLSAGIGRETANSFLVVASASGGDPCTRLHDYDAWLSSSERREEFLEKRGVRRQSGGWSIEPLDQRPEVHNPPLMSRRSAVPVVLGANLEDEIVSAAGKAESPNDVRPLLLEWWSSARPWLSADGYHVDVMPRNFIRDAAGELHYIDREWLWTQDAPESWALLRSMWFLVLDRLWPSGSTAGLSWSLSLGEMALALGRLVSPDLSPADLARAAEHEAQLQSRVSGRPAADELPQLQELLARSVTLLSTRPALAQILERPLIVEQQAQAREKAAELRELQAMDDIIGHRAEMEALRWQVSDLQGKNAWLRNRDMRAQARRVRRLAGRVKGKLLG